MDQQQAPATQAESPFEILANGQRLQFAWDATSLSTFKACPRKFYYAQVLGLRGKERAAPLDFGGFLHDMLEKFDRALAGGKDHETAVREVVRYGLGVTTTYAELPLLDSNGAPVLDEQGMPMNARQPVFWGSDDNRRTRQTLIRTFIWSTEQFRNDPLKTMIMPSGKPALELSFRLELPIKTPNGRNYLWCGHMDKICEVQGHPYIQERKHTVTTLSPTYFDKYSPNTQVTGYIFSAGVVLGRPVMGAFIDAAQVAVGFSRFGRSIQNRTPDQIDEWYKGSLYWIKQAEACAEANYYPMNEESCSNFGGCPFRNVCSKDQKVRKMYLDQDFQHRAWNPLQDREVL